MRKFYKARRNTVVSLLEACAFSQKLTILEQDAGLHFLLKIDTTLSDRELTRRLAETGIRVHSLSDYYHGRQVDTHCLVVNYSGLTEDALAKALKEAEGIM